MKMEFLADGAPECPLLRLYDFDTKQAGQLQSLLSSLADGTQNEKSLQEALSAEAVEDCRLVLQVADKDQGIVWNAQADTFFCRLRCSSWESVAELVWPFCVSSVAGTFQWLNETSRIRWLLSPNGLW